MRNTSLKEKKLHSKENCPLRCCKIAPPNPLNLEELVANFKDKKEQIKEYLDSYKNSNKYFECAARSICPECGKKHPHQYCIPKETLETFHEKLNKQKECIETSKDFEELHENIKSQKVEKVGPLTIYDVSLRIAARLDILPEKFVYLHSGARIPGFKGEKVEKKCFVKPLQKLKAYEIEDFLCIYKSILEKERFQLLK